MTIKARPDLPIGTGEVAKYLKIFWGKVGEFIWGLRFWFSLFRHARHAASYKTIPFPMPPLFNTAVKDICAINTFEKLFNILLSEVYF